MKKKKENQKNLLDDSGGSELSRSEEAK